MEQNEIINVLKKVKFDNKGLATNLELFYITGWGMCNSCFDDLYLAMADGAHFRIIDDTKEN